MTRWVIGLLLLTLGLGSLPSVAQSAPATPGETLSGKRLVLAETVKGHSAVLIAGFSKEAGDRCGEWVKAIHADAAMAGVPVYQMAMLGQAPGFMRGMIKSGMRKGLSPAEQDAFVVLTQDEPLWRSYFGVTTDREAYVVLLDAHGQVLWHGHGAAKDLEPLMRAAKR